MIEFLSVLIYIGIGTAIVLLSFYVARLVRRHNPYRAQIVNYERAEQPAGLPRLKINLRLFIFALIFLMFDVGVTFLLLWAMAPGHLGLFGLIEMVLFVLILLFGLFYAWKIGALKFGPIMSKRSVRTTSDS